MTVSNPVIDPEISDLVTRLQQIEEEFALLAAQQQDLQRQLHTAETARDKRRKRTAPSRVVATMVVVDEHVDEQQNDWPNCLREATSTLPTQVGDCGGETRRIPVDFRQ